MLLNLEGIFVLIIISKYVFYEIEDGMFKLEPNVNLLFIVIIDAGFARKCLSTVNCAAQKFQQKKGSRVDAPSNTKPTSQIARAGVC